ncbi:putative quinol monooxygenase [Chitinophaga sp.]|uniref:putative quinol monooxygenase n=1 Tax=Chitinophaga sp. TaxID=1869181 RepID=UPI0031D63734
MNIYVFAKWQVKEGQLNTVLELLKVAAAKSREEEGNLFYDIHQSQQDVNTLLLYEGYTSEAAVAEHRNSAYFQELVVGQIVPLLENREVTVASKLDTI